MKRLIKIFAVVVLAVLFASCEREEPSLNLNASDFAVLAKGGSQTVSFECNYNWTATASDPWISVSPASGNKGANSITIQVSENTGSSARNGSVTIDCSGLTRTVRVSQAQPFSQNISIVFTGSSLNAPKISGNGLNAEIDWGDGSIETYSATLKHSYSSSGSHTVTIKLAGGTAFEISNVTGISELDFQNF